MRLYGELAPWYPLITAAEDYAEEADHVLRLIEAARDGEAETLLELGAGPGHLASHLKTRLRCTLTDLSEDMLTLSRDQNPECAHLRADMRQLDLGRHFDVVLVQDAIAYMTSEADLRATITTVAAQLRPGGLALLIPDDIKDDFAPATRCGGRDAPDGRSLRYLEWAQDPDPSDDTIQIDYALLLREPGRPLRLEQESHLAGLFARATWLRLLRAAGLEPLDIQVPDPYAGEHTVFVARKA